MAKKNKKAAKQKAVEAEIVNKTGAENAQEEIQESVISAASIAAELAKADGSIEDAEVLELAEEQDEEIVEEEVAVAADADTTEAAVSAIADGSLITDRGEIEKTLEALVFAAPKAISLKRIKAIMASFNYDITDTTDILDELIARYETRGFQLVKVGGSYQFRSNAAQSDVLQKLLEDRPVRLGQSALEVLAIIAYKQPVSRSEIDAVRGVDSGHLTRGLLEKNLIRTLGHAETAGRPLLYGTTPYFLEVFSLDSLDALPSLEDFERELAKKSDSEGAENDSDEPAVLAADPGSDASDVMADFFDRPSPLAANPDRGSFDEKAEDDDEAADFGVSERAREEVGNA